MLNCIISRRDKPCWPSESGNGASRLSQYDWECALLVPLLRTFPSLKGNVAVVGCWVHSSADNHSDYVEVVLREKKAFFSWAQSPPSTIWQEGMEIGGEENYHQKWLSREKCHGSLEANVSLHYQPGEKAFLCREQNCCSTFARAGAGRSSCCCFVLTLAVVIFMLKSISTAFLAQNRILIAEKENTKWPNESFFFFSVENSLLH